MQKEKALRKRVQMMQVIQNSAIVLSLYNV